VNETEQSAGELIDKLIGNRTRAEVAAAIGVRPQAVSAWIHGGSITWKHARALDDYLGADGAIIAAFGKRVEDVSRRGGPGSARTGLAPVLRALEELDRDVAERIESLGARHDALEQALHAQGDQFDERSADLVQQLLALFDRVDHLERQAGIESPEPPARPRSKARSRRARPTPPPKTP
jgi:plasmid maintenance system antidote protein VapI